MILSTQKLQLQTGKNNPLFVPHSMILTHGLTALYFKSNVAENCRKQRRKIVCCCPWSSSDDSKEQKQIDGESIYPLGQSTTVSSTPTKLTSGSQKNFITCLFSFPFFSSKSKKLKNLKSTKSHGSFPPRPQKVPLIVCLNHLLGSFLHHSDSVPYHYPLRDLGDIYGPLMHIKFLEASVFVVSSPEVAKQVLKIHDPAFADRQRTMATEILSFNYDGIVFSPYGEHWRQMRKICISELLSIKNVRSFEYIRKDEASYLIESVRSSSGVISNLTERIFYFMISVTCRAVFGKVHWDRDTLLILMKQELALIGHFDMSDLFPSFKILDFINLNKIKLLKTRSKIDTIFDSIIEEHKGSLKTTKKVNGELGTEDLIDVFLRLEESRELEVPITNNNIKAVIWDMLAAGTETSSTTVNWAMAELMKHPHVMAKAQDEIRQAFNGKETINETEVKALKYLKLVINETLRLHPPLALIPRACREEIEMEGYNIPLNSIFIINAWALGRDPKYWKNPESFEPERFDGNPIDFMGNHFEYLPFGSGKRICPGISFGLTSVQYLLALLLYHFDWFLAPGTNPEDLDMTEAYAMTVTRKSNLYLIAKPYDPSIGNEFK